METRYVETAVAVADRGSFTAVARDRHMSPSTISRHIAALEAEVGTSLFHRGGGVVSVTDAGEVFLSGASEILEAVDAAVTRARAAEAGRAG